ncbi:uncharacterized protein A1O5_11203 [Cladophialophora psammophila CBS 110553]|uniref:Uncharacterized protein n=1 Tax=Cladophialophora psammophila CBS 110553 TaxID=1182543 RepID=W9WM05_9EURO|nr:uncharacterized protein A1O5_11203 [Cladophialophora psammophila CBS 110553]EXJ65676.1 hypothetical protein A1O5_11203 [Cladophialophora psammophila CBS 110553]
MASPARRVLGDRDPNAPMHQQPSKVPNRALPLASPIAQPSAVKRPLPSGHSPSSSPRVGQKRKIGAVHDHEQAGSQDTVVTATPLSPTSALLSATQSENEDNAQISMAQSRSTLDTALTSFCDSQEESSQMESEFHIHDEPSQQTLDKMHAVTFSQSTSQLVPPLRPNLAKEASQSSLSMSSLIDFDNNRSSEDEDMQMIEELERAKEKRPKTEKDARKEMMLEKAETLRTRLQLALYKIQTNQITRPFARLQVPKVTSPPPQLTGSSSSPRSSSTVRPSPGPENSAAQETRVAMARARATMGPRPAIKLLSSLPMPEIVPTAFSARWNHKLEPQQGSQSSEVHPLPNIPSSPPLLRADYSAEHLTVGATHQDTEPSTPLQLSSPAPSGHGDDVEADTDLRRKSLQGVGLTSSVIKGEAANSLLELVRGVRSGGIGMCGV